MENIYYEYGQKEMDYLKKKDEKLGIAINNIGMIKRTVMPDIFYALVDSLISQQISGKAAQTIMNRLQLICSISPENICAVSMEQIQSCGTSFRKAQYVKGVAEAVMTKEIDINMFPHMSDEDIEKTLMSIKGVGKWTAEMMLIFSLERPDVLSFGDLAIRRGIMHLYGLSDLTKEKFEVYRKRYSPYGTVASFYLWALS